MAADSLNKLIIIGGGSGFIGSHLSKTLLSKGYTVKIISRSKGLPVNTTTNQPSTITWDEVKSNGLPKCHAVIGLQGQNIMNMSRRWTEDFKRELWDSRVHTTALLRQVIQDTRCTSVFVSTSAVGIYPPDPEQTYAESYVPSDPTDSDRIDPLLPDASFLTSLCRGWEEAARPKLSKNDASGQKPVRTCIIRNGVVLGRTGGIIRSLFLPYSLGLGSKSGSGNQWFPWIHIRDLVSIYIRAIEGETGPRSGEARPEGQPDKPSCHVYNGVAPEPCTNAQFVRALSSALNRPAFGIPIPAAILRLMLGTVRAGMLLEGQKVLPQATVSELGMTYLYPSITEACQALVKEPQD